MLQTAESIRAAGHPEWFQLVGLLHDMGKIMFLWGDRETGQEVCFDSAYLYFCRCCRGRSCLSRCRHRSRAASQRIEVMVCLQAHFFGPALSGRHPRSIAAPSRGSHCFPFTLCVSLMDRVVLTDTSGHWEAIPGWSVRFLTHLHISVCPLSVAAVVDSCVPCPTLPYH
jgi:hypothetical protein